jgi:hypothetical protein
MAVTFMLKDRDVVVMETNKDKINEGVGWPAVRLRSDIEKTGGSQKPERYSSPF